MHTQPLQNLSLSKKAIETYIASLELGPSTIQKIARKAGLARSSTYLFIDELKNKGLISQSKVGKKTVLTATEPDRLVQIAQEKKQRAESMVKQLDSLMPHLQAIYNKQPGKPSVRFYEGFEGVKTIMEETLEAKEILVLCSGYDEPIEKKLDKYLDEYFEEVDKRGIQTYEILGGSYDLEPYIKKYQSKLHQIREVDFRKIGKEKGKIAHIDKMIYGNKVAIVSYEYLNGVVVENRQIVEFERRLFFKLWTSLGNRKERKEYKGSAPH